MLKKTIQFFDKLEDHIRIRLSHYPIIYSCVAAVGIVLIWKGVWESAEYFPVLFGPVSIVLGLIILLVTGLMVSFFVGDSILISGFKRGKKMIDKTEAEVRSEDAKMDVVMAELSVIEHELREMRGEKAGKSQVERIREELPS